ncbi:MULTISPECIES: gliding motility protein GldM [Myroides]|uniref:Gliding motility protein GldM n=1 Tax=Myroides odoratimimus TaxID=76832 RepID=A0AAI8C390_9FLAO|nr:MULTISPECIES: gliding motility protein GldM [Myroides]AJA67938.1 gliding motility-associated protein GldM [Myroides sp. A21]ALU25215.1 gliding motility protein GldM [Myroides odoratimimus]APA91261.1 gliding motility protein GldM [Myroides sp. ZB35]EHO05342.1 gliding motility-associated protein GldM [Myroides odoratimimus CCUG 12901]EKB02397.1 gliding motility-associated protein GldM [Myroides odoratimimus CCUG 3837]
MAKQKLTPRQKMINLMYLVFIAMMALQVSTEVLSAFGVVNEKFEAANEGAKANNEGLLGALEKKAEENPAQFADPAKKAKQVEKITQEFYDFVGKYKTLITSEFEGERTENGKLPAERMNKSDIINDAWFTGDNYSAEGQAFIDGINKYKKALLDILEKDAKFQPIVLDINSKFNLNDVKDSQGKDRAYLNYNFYGFPAIASLTKLSTMQNDAKIVEAEIYNSLMGNTLSKAASMKNYQAIVVADKSTLFAGETYKGKVVLGRYDKSTVPTKVVVNGQNIDLSKSLVDGQVNLGFTVGNVGEHQIGGKFTFVEDGQPVEIDIKGSYVVVPKPNSANISADKMNVVYRGVSNPMTISFAGIANDKVQASAPGLTSQGGGKYTLRPQSGREVVINVTGTLPDGQKVSDRKVFRIKDIPSPRGTVRGEFNAKGPKSNLEIVTIGAKLEDFDFDLNLTVTSFVLQIPGQPSIVVPGNRMNERAKAAIRRAQLGDVVVISDIKVRLEGAGDYALKKTSPCTFEIM